MGRKAKIGMAVVLVAAGGVAVTALLRGREAAVQVSYLRVSSAGPHRVLFTITNGTSEYLWYSVFSCPVSHRGVDMRSGRFDGTSGSVGPSNATMFSVNVPSLPGRWAPVVSCRPVEFKPSSRDRLAQWAANHHWFRISEWLRPRRQYEKVLGPEMLGNQPASSP